jgi:branched-subunit amino acid aminotransferase/4-amino-4-deoxychorismate lyase
MYGDGCFETFRVYRGQFFKLEAHLKRMHEGISWLGLDFPADLKVARLKPLIRQLLQRNKLVENDAVVRLQVWRQGTRGYGTDENTKVSYSIMVTRLPDTGKVLTLSTVDTRRIPSAALPSAFKLCNNINYIAATAEARGNGADDALMQTIGGHISETTIGNLFWLSGATIFTPSIDCDLLPGITRQTVIKLAKQLNAIQLKQGAFELKAIYKAEAVWMTNSVRGLQPVGNIDRYNYAVDHPVYRKMEQDFSAYLTANLTD